MAASSIIGMLGVEISFLVIVFMNLMYRVGAVSITGVLRDSR